MADSYIDYGTGGTLTSDQKSGLFTGITFDYLSVTHFEVILTKGTTGVKTTLTYATSSAPFTVTTGPPLQVQLDFSNITDYTALVDGDLVRIQRSTPISELQRTFADGSVLKASDLNAQTQQLLFGLQENVDQGIGSLPLDTDLRFDADNRQIKNLLTPTDSHHATTKEYVDYATVYPGGGNSVVPQVWAFTAAGADIEGDNREYTLADANAVEENFYLIEVGGVLQHPDSYTVTNPSAGNYKLTLLGGATGVTNGTSINVRNFGVSRNVASQPFTSPSGDTSSTLMQLQPGAGTWAGKALDIKTQAGTSVIVADGQGSVMAEGTAQIRVGSQSDALECARIRNTATGPQVLVRDVDATSATNYGLEFTASDDCGFANIQGKSGNSSEKALEILHGTTSVIVGYYSGQLDVGIVNASGSVYVGDGTGSTGAKFTAKHDTGNVFADGYLRLGGETTANNPGEIAATKGLFAGDVTVAGGHGSGTGTTLATDGSIYATGSSAYVRGPYMVADAGTTKGYTCSSTTAAGAKSGLIFITSGSGDGPALMHNTADATEPYLKVQSDKISVTNGPLQLSTEGTSDAHAVTKSYVDSSAGWELLETITLTSGDSQQAMNTINMDSYHRIRFEYENVKADAASKYIVFAAYDDSGTPAIVPVLDRGDAIDNDLDVNKTTDTFYVNQPDGIETDTKPLYGWMEMQGHDSATMPSMLSWDSMQMNADGTDMDVVWYDAARVYFNLSKIRTLKISAADGSNLANPVGFASGTVRVYGSN